MYLLTVFQHTIISASSVQPQIRLSTASASITRNPVSFDTEATGFQTEILHPTTSAHLSIVLPTSTVALQKCDNNICIEIFPILQDQAKNLRLPIACTVLKTVLIHHQVRKKVCSQQKAFLHSLKIILYR